MADPKGFDNALLAQALRSVCHHHASTLNVFSQDVLLEAARRVANPVKEVRVYMKDGALQPLDESDKEIRIGRKPKYPWETLAVDEHFTISDGSVSLYAMRSRACHMRKRLGKEFIVREVEEGIRVWRTK